MLTLIFLIRIPSIPKSITIYDYGEDVFLFYSGNFLRGQSSGDVQILTVAVT